MANQKFLFIYRRPANQNDAPPSPEEMQKSMASWYAWRDRYKSQIVSFGDGLKPEGRVLTTASVTDGPYVEAKEVVGGFSIVAAPGYEAALEVARACPFLHMPGARIEVREMMGYE
jgi:hypothetical protein